MIGSAFGHYRIIEQLGAGGMGVVYRAHDDELDRDVALKFLTADTIQDETARARLVREARAASALNHPNICQIYEIGRVQDRDYIAMEFVTGSPLRATIPPEGLPVESAIRYGAQIADALAHAHEQGVIHRDLKSANVMVTLDGRIKVLDFGLAKRSVDSGDGLADFDLSLTAAGVVLGTPAYFAPEVLRGEKPDAKSDLWALGVVLYEMVTGRLPFSGGTLSELTSSILNDSAPPVSRRIPLGLSSTIQRCLAKEPSQRYRSAREVWAALDALQSGERTVVAERRPRRSRAAVVAVASTGTAFAALAAALAMDAGGLRGKLVAGFAAAPGGGQEIRSLAVLPLANLSGDSTQDYFAAGMTEELITSLAPIRSLKVISRTSVMRFAGTNKSIPQIARELGVDGIVEGSVLRSGDRVRITAQLIQAPQDKHLWARSYERDLRDVLTLQREVARDIAQEIRIQLTPQESARMGAGRPVNPQAYELYLKGRYEWGKLTPESMQTAINYFQRAIALDPHDARSYSGLADSYIIESQLLSLLPMDQAMPKVKENARQALALDDYLAEAHTSMACVHFFFDWDQSEAEREVRRALELNPGYPTAHVVYSALLGTQGHFNESIAHDRLAIESDPMSLLANWDLIGELSIARRFDEAVAQAQKTLELYPNSPIVLFSLAGAYEMKGDYANAIATLERAMSASPEGKELAGRLRRGYDSGGYKGYLHAMLDHLKTTPQGPGTAFRMAQITALLGDHDQSFMWLDRAAQARNADLLWFKVLPPFDSLRKDSRYTAFVRRLGLDSAS